MRGLPVVFLFVWMLLGSYDDARAAEGLFLTWGDCALPGGGTPVQSFTCDSDLGFSNLICSFGMGVPADSVIGLEIVVDLQHSAPVLPDWWGFHSTGCRAGSLTANNNFSGLSLCQDFWQATASGGLASYTVGMPRGSPNQARMRIALGLPSDQLRTLNTTDTYYGARILLSNSNTGACGGCAGSVCLVLNSILVRRPLRPPEAPSGDILLTTPGPANGNWAAWQMATANCDAVPVRRTTWGAVKALYR